MNEIVLALCKKISLVHMVHGYGLEILRYGRWSKDFVEDGNN